MSHERKRGGGRSHGLSPSGPTKPRQMRLGTEAEVRLAFLMAATGKNASEVVRGLILAPSAVAEDAERERLRHEVEGLRDVFAEGEILRRWLRAIEDEPTASVEAKAMAADALASKLRLDWWLRSDRSTG